MQEVCSFDYFLDWSLEMEGLSIMIWKMSAMMMVMVLGNGSACWPDIVTVSFKMFVVIHAFMHLDTSKLLKITYTMHTIVWTNFNFRYMYIIYYTGPNNSELEYFLCEHLHTFSIMLTKIDCNIFRKPDVNLLWSKYFFLHFCLVSVKVMSQLKYGFIETWQLIEAKLSKSIF